ncbi:type II/IV secretion system ATPase subunit [Helicobacter sp. L8]|uniref:ATPase, T2SS/T4P/T4SS family n=1 Tax=Helicobacter sp. L8 TaxID=2316078 RepID=UPI000EB4052E|nr:type II/IV secretion system ATPase subunit [Helicobacter sp. L8]
MLNTHRVLQAQIALFTPYLQSGISELISNYEKEIWLYKSDHTRQKILEPALSKEFLTRFCEQLASYYGLPFNSAHPMLNASLPFSRCRVSANHFSITTTQQISLNIRVPSAHSFSLHSFSLGARCAYGYAHLQEWAQSGRNILISGGTASGKTSLLNALLACIPKQTRLVSVEDSQELDLSAFENAVGLLVSKAEENLRYEDALNMAVRMRPDRLMVGEIDTRNTLLFLRLGNTGHKGMLSTLHANSVDQVLEAIALNLEMGSQARLPLSVVERYAKSAIDVVIQVAKINNTHVIQEVLLAQDLGAKLG